MGKKRSHQTKSPLCFATLLFDSSRKTVYCKQILLEKSIQMIALNVLDVLATQNCCGNAKNGAFSKSVCLLDATLSIKVEKFVIIKLLKLIMTRQIISSFNLRKLSCIVELIDKIQLLPCCYVYYTISIIRYCFFSILFLLLLIQSIFSSLFNNNFILIGTI